MFEHVPFRLVVATQKAGAGLVASHRLEDGRHGTGLFHREMSMRGQTMHR